ncbi:MAG: YvaD family protein [bacterium]|nr:YvaD family protein [bacterium]
MKKLKYYFWVVDIGFILYWLTTLLKIIPDEYLFKDYENPILIAWNWSFLPLDLCISFTGLLSLWLWKNSMEEWRSMALISLVLTFCSGLQAVAFWVIRADFDPNWWIPNLFLLIYPLFFIPKLISKKVQLL